MSKISKISSIEAFRTLKNDKIIASMNGRFKAYRMASKNLAQIAIEDFDAFKNTQSMTVRNIPLFSKIGFKIVKVQVFNIFVPKTPEEKMLNKLIRAEKNKRTLNKYIQK